MELKHKKLLSIVTIIGLLIFASVLLTGCEKSKPETTEPATMEMDHNMAEPEAVVAKTAAGGASVTEQTLCPVMDGNKIDKNIFVEYQGKKVYFCCSGCKAKFLAEPEKYLAKLPQFKQ